MKRANGTGTIVRLSGNRRKPFVVNIPSSDRRGYVVQNVLGYYPSARDAQAALEDYNVNKDTRSAPAPDRLSMSLQAVYDLWSARKYAKAGAASVVSYKASWKRLSELAGLTMRSITVDQLQAIIDHDEAYGLSKSSINNDRLLMRALYAFAMERDIVSKDYSAFVQLPSVGPKYEKGILDDLQMKKLEQMAANGFPWADTVLMLCYTGFRITEFLSLTPFSYHADDDCLRGGIKTEAGRNRAVPVHPKIKPYLIEWIAKGGETIICNESGGPVSSHWYRNRAFKSVVEALGISDATPHWCRHTFASRLHAAGVAELERKRLLGHANKDVTEYYTHTDITQLTAAIRLLA